jgi:acyl-CoA ligase (AMP-forming) (exosortase A-associated)
MRCRVHDLITESAARAGESPALSFGEVTLDYATLGHKVGQVATFLQRLGVQRNDRVGIYLDKRIETVTAIFGTSAAGGVFVPVNPLLKARQVRYILADCAARVLITTTQRFELMRNELAELPALTTVILLQGPIEAAGAPGGPPIPDGVQLVSWNEADAAQAAVRDCGVIDQDMAAILYTSGSTGNPKGVVVSHRNLICGAESVASYLGNGPHDVILAALPLSFDAGFSQLTTTFSSGAHAVLVNYLLPSDVVRACTRFGVTALTCVPPLWIQLVDQKWPADTAQRLRYFANTGGRMPKATLDKLRSLFSNAAPYLMYGLTEAFRSTYLDPAEVDDRPDSIGKAIPNAEILVVRPDGTVCDPGEEGELVHRGALVSLGYWGDPARTAERFRPAPGTPAGITNPELAVFSGDAVVRDEAGYLYFVGRKDDMIKTSGYRVSPSEIEEAVYDTGMVRDAVAMGIADDEIGQVIAIVVSAAQGSLLDTGALLAELRKQLPLYMVPREVIVRDEIPRSPNGKFDRTRIREELAS